MASDTAVTQPSTLPPDTIRDIETIETPAWFKPVQNTVEWCSRQIRILTDHLGPMGKVVRCAIKSAAYVAVFNLCPWYLSVAAVVVDIAYQSLTLSKINLKRFADASGFQCLVWSVTNVTKAFTSKDPVSHLLYALGTTISFAVFIVQRYFTAKPVPPTPDNQQQQGQLTH
jgi:hypothetical protein